jgi:hypothetical protein
MSFHQIDQVSDQSSHNVGPKTEESVFEHIDNVPEYRRDDTGSLHLEKKVTITDPVFGEILEDGPNYRNVHLPQQRASRSKPYEYATDAT